MLQQFRFNQANSQHADVMEPNWADSLVEAAGEESDPSREPSRTWRC